MFIYERYNSHLDFIQAVKASKDWLYIKKNLENRAKKNPRALLETMIEECDQNMKATTFKAYWVMFHSAEKTIGKLWHEKFSIALFECNLMLMLRVELVEQICSELDDVEPCDPLHTSKAMALWRKLQAKGWIDGNLQPKVSNRKAAIIADELATALSLDPRWPAIEKLWGKSDLSTEYSKSAYAQYYGTFKKEVRNLLQ